MDLKHRAAQLGGYLAVSVACIYGGVILFNVVLGRVPNAWVFWAMSWLVLSWLT